MKQLVDLHGGTIDDTAKERKGATFMVRLPLHAQLLMEPPALGAAPGRRPRSRASTA